MRKRKLYEKVCAGSKNLRFAELQTLAKAAGRERIPVSLFAAPPKQEPK